MNRSWSNRLLRIGTFLLLFGAYLLFLKGPAANNKQQAFRVGQCAWGLQFHPESRKEQVVAWWSDGRELPRPLEALSGELDEKLPAWQELGRRVCLAFLDVAGA